MSCECTEKISSLIDGELTATEAREVERHLVTCDECQQVRADFMNLRRQITGFEPALQPEIQRQALAKIVSKGQRNVAPFADGPGWKWAFNPAVIAFASMILVGVIVGLLFYQQSKLETAPPQEIAVDVRQPSPSPSVEEVKKPVPSPSIEDSNIPKPNDPKPSESPKESGNKNDSGSKSPRVEPTPARRPAPPVREPKPGEQFATNTERVRPADAETMTAMHLEKSETLLRSFRNLRVSEPGAAMEVSYERQRAQQLVYQNMMLRREADAAGDVEVASLLENLEPILLDIANLPDDADEADVQIIKDRVERKNIVGQLQVNSMALARALD
jgi:hypothetical protein